jgi:FkbM family methyltransferase
VRAFDGLWWPDADVRARPVIVAQCAEAMPVVLPLAKGFKVCVQAGGNCGVYPLALAKHFEKVITFEPDAENIACLRRNVTLENVAIVHAALGARDGTCAVKVVEGDNCGAHKTVAGNDVEVWTIDGMNLDACDLIWLDIEGAEAEAINGARATIEKFSPIIVLEEKGLGAKADLPGYSRLMRIGNDTVYRRT